MAGVGRIHELEDHDYLYGMNFRTYGLEIEPEWAELHPRTKCGDVLHLRKYYRRTFDAIVVSPTYGNRMADHHNARDASLRRSYFHDKGSALHPNNSGQMYWGDRYRELHEAAWYQCSNVIPTGGLFILNIKNHIKRGVEQKVRQWHLKALRQVGFKRLESIPVTTPSMKAGENRDLRLTEYVYVLRKG